MREGNLNFSNETHSDLDCFLRDNTTLWLDWRQDTFAALVLVWLRLNIVLRPELDKLVFKDSVTDLMACYFAEPVDSRNLSVLNSEVNFNVTAVLLLGLGRTLGPTNDL
jgi:hypothetical protein